MTESATQPMRVLFLCIQNSSRSHIAEGLLRARGGADYEVFSLIAATINHFLGRQPAFSLEQLYAAAKAEEQQA